MPSPLERALHAEMLDIYKRAKSETGYNASRFLSMVSERGGLETARALLHAPTISDGYRALWQYGRLDLTVEAVILDEKWHELFTESERHIAKERLQKFGSTGSLDEDGT